MRVEPMHRSSSRLERSRMLVAEMEDIGADIVGTLAENREKIAAAHEKVKVANSELDKADKITKRMGRFGASW
jgi:outer membrane protein TolC